MQTTETRSQRGIDVVFFTGFAAENVRGRVRDMRRQPAASRHSVASRQTVSTRQSVSLLFAADEASDYDTDRLSALVTRQWIAGSSQRHPALDLRGRSLTSENVQQMQNVWPAAAQVLLLVSAVEGAECSNVLCALPMSHNPIHFAHLSTVSNN